MNNERAITILKARSEFVADVNLDAQVAYALAIKALKKQMHEKIEIYDFGKAHCPSCKTDIHGKGVLDYCPYCGKGLSWR